MGKVHISALGFRFLGFEILLGSGLGLMTFGLGQAWVNEVQDKLRSSFFSFFRQFSIVRLPKPHYSKSYMVLFLYYWRKSRIYKSTLWEDALIEDPVY